MADPPLRQVEAQAEAGDSVQQLELAGPQVRATQALALELPTAEEEAAELAELAVCRLGVTEATMVDLGALAHRAA